MKTIRKGTTIAAVIVCLFVAIWLTAITLTPAKALDYGARNLVIPFNGEANFVVVLREFGTGNVVDGSAGTCTASTTWANGEITATQHTISNDWIVAIPTTDVQIMYGTIYHKAHASVDKTTTPDEDPFIYDASTGKTFGDSNPIQKGKVRTE